MIIVHLFFYSNILFIAVRIHVEEMFGKCKKKAKKKKMNPILTNSQ